MKCVVATNSKVFKTKKREGKDVACVVCGKLVMNYNVCEECLKKFK